MSAIGMCASCDTSRPLTSGSGESACSPPPSGGCLRACLNRRAGVVRRVQQLGGELLGHGLARRGRGPKRSASASPATAAVALDLDRHLVGRAADAARLDLEQRAWRCAAPARRPRSGCGELCARSMSSADRRCARPGSSCRRSMSLLMKRVTVRLPKRGSAGTSRLITRARRGMLNSPSDDPGTSLVQAVQRTAASTRAFVQYLPEVAQRPIACSPGRAGPICLGLLVASGPPLERLGYLAGALGAFAPYFDRPCLRFLTPPASSAPRTMW